MLAAMTHPSRVLNLDMKAKLCMPKSYIYIYIYIYIYVYTYIYTHIHVSFNETRNDVYIIYVFSNCNVLENGSIDRTTSCFIRCIDNNIIEVSVGTK